MQIKSYFGTDDMIKQNREIVEKAVSLSFIPKTSQAQIDAIIANPYAVFVLAFNPNPVGLAIVTLPITKEDIIPQVIAFTTIKPGVRVALAKGVVDFIHKAGYNTFWAINATGRSDEIWTKAFTPTNWEANPIGSIMEFKING